ncbi:MAG: DUF2281 domain-containing protein [Chitinophagales bacterium]
MTKEALLNNISNTIAKLPDDRIREVNDFADFLLKKYEEEMLQKGITDLISKSKTYDFLKEEEDLYTLNDLKERYK